MRKFRAYLLSNKENEKDRLKDFEDVNEKVDQIIQNRKDPFFGGDYLNIADALFAIIIAGNAVFVLPKYKNYDIYKEYSNIKRYCDRVSQTKAWKSIHFDSDSVE